MNRLGMPASRPRQSTKVSSSESPGQRLSLMLRKKERLTLVRERERQAKMPKITEDSSTRFKELIQELVEEHALELEHQRVVYEEIIRHGQKPSDMREGRGTLYQQPQDMRETSLPRTSVDTHNGGDADEKNSNSSRGSVPGTVPEASDMSSTRGSTSGPEAPTSTKLAPCPPREAPPTLQTVEETFLLGTARVPKVSVARVFDSGDMLNIVPSACRASEQELHDLGCRDTLKTWSPDLSGMDTEDIDVDGSSSHNVRAAVNWQGATSKWATIVQLVMSIAAADLHFPRQVWLGKRLNKHLACKASSQLKKMMSNVHDKPSMTSFMNRGRAQSLSLVSMSWARRYLPLDPHAFPRLLWISIAVLIMLYDLIYVPMQTFDLPDSVALKVIDFTAQVFWTLDIFSNFVTAVYSKSMLERRPYYIARIYAKSWLLFDVVVTLPPWYYMLSGEEDTSDKLSNFRSVRAMRLMLLMRFLRLVRLAKFDYILRGALEVINSSYTHLIIGTVKLMASLCIFNHVSCCIWFGIGSGRDGWVEREDFADQTLWYQYLGSMHWALTQFQGNSEFDPGTIEERGYAVAFLLLALIILACFVSSLTNKMGELTQLHNDQHTQQRAVRNYLSENKISKQLSVQINRYTEWNRKQKQRKQQDAEVLLVLPTKLLMDLYQEVRAPVLAMHPFFRTFRDSFDRVLRRVCFEALEQKAPCPSDLVYAEGDECHHMYFILTGRLRYEPHPASIGKVNISSERMQSQDWEEEIDMEDSEVPEQVLESSVFRPIRLKENNWLSEAVLWTEWVHCGDLIGLEDCALLMLDAKRFAEIVETFATARFVASLYARHFVVSINRFGQVFTDVINNHELFDYDVLDRCELEPKAEGGALPAMQLSDSVHSTNILRNQLFDKLTSS